jgi:hypothetical protein
MPIQALAKSFSVKSYGIFREIKIGIFPKKSVVANSNQNLSEKKSQRLLQPSWLQEPLGLFVCNQVLYWYKMLYLLFSTVWLIYNVKCWLG